MSPRRVLALWPGLIGLALQAACGDASPAAPDLNDPGALLTDAQLATPSDPDEAAVDPAWDAWIRQNHFTIRSLTSPRSEDLQFLKSVIGTRRLVQLGESGHGVRQFNQAKVRLIRFLHEEMGFDVIAFESGLYECWHANRLADDAAELTMRRCIFGVWHTEEVVELFRYLRETRSTARPLILAGFDVQTSSSSGNQSARGFLAEVVSRVDPARSAGVRSLDSSFSAELSRISGWTAGNIRALADSMVAVDVRERFSVRFDSLRAFIDAHATALSAAYASEPAVPLIARQTAWSRVQYIGQTRSAGTDASWLWRDRGMADNIDFLLDRVHPGKKMIVWAHNAHIMHDRAAMRPVSAAFVPPASMGSWVASRRRGELYTVGLFMYRGDAANNAGITYRVRPPLAGSLEAVLYRPRKRWVFADLLGQSRVAGNGWMFDAIPGKEWGTNDYRFVPRAQFDAILFIDSVTPPRYCPGGLGNQPCLPR